MIRFAAVSLLLLPLCGNAGERILSFHSDIRVMTCLLYTSDAADDRYKV